MMVIQAPSKWTRGKRVWKKSQVRLCTGAPVSIKWRQVLFPHSHSVWNLSMSMKPLTFLLTSKISFTILFRPDVQTMAQPGESAGEPVARRLDTATYHRIQTKHGWGFATIMVCFDPKFRNSLLKCLRFSPSYENGGVHDQVAFCICVVGVSKATRSHTWWCRSILEPDTVNL